MDVICKNIRYLRHIHKLSQMEMARILGISIGSLRKMERGVLPRCFRAHTVCKICDHFQISADGILRQDLETENPPQT